MRSEDFPAKRSSPEEVRVMILIDSIMHGGNWMSNSEIAASLMKSRLQQ
jgi:hypothetical protein